MKTILLAVTLTLGAGNMFATFVQCTPNQGDFLNTPVGGPAVGVATTFTCSPSAVACNITGDGFNVTGITILVSASAQVAGGTAATTYTATATITNNASLTNPGTLNFSCLTDSNGSCVAGPVSGTASTAVGPVDQFNTFTVTVTGHTGAPSLANGTAAVFYQATDTIIQQTGTPEPATFGLLGFGMLGAGLLARRRAAKK